MHRCGHDAAGEARLGKEALVGGEVVAPGAGLLNDAPPHVNHDALHARLAQRAQADVQRLLALDDRHLPTGRVRPAAGRRVQGHRRLRALAAHTQLAAAGCVSRHGAAQLSSVACQVGTCLLAIALHQPHGVQGQHDVDWQAPAGRAGLRLLLRAGRRSVPVVAGLLGRPLKQPAASRD